MITRGDLVVIAACVALIVACWAAFAPARGTPRTAIIEVVGASPITLPLDRDTLRRVEGRRGVSVIELRGGRARFVDSDCPQKLCVRAGWLSAAGDASACLPNGVSLRLVGAEPELDAITF